jgi:Lrp/AsnC family transcriptional regulator for asnA, asnC and gidA
VRSAAAYRFAVTLPRTRPRAHDVRQNARPFPLRLAVDMPDLDRAIISALQVDGRRPYAHLARDLDVGENTVRRRVRALREAGLIDITTVTDPELLGYGAMALVGVHLDGSRPASEVATALAQLAAVDYVVVTTGRYELFAELLCRDDQELSRTIERDLAAVPGVRQTEIFPYLRLHYQQPRWEAARWKATGEGLRRGIPVFDEVDRRILAELNADGRTALQEVARRLAISESQARQRVTRMLNSGVVRILGITNPRSLGFTTLAWLGIVAAPGVRLEALADELASLGSIAYLAVCASRFDVFAEAICVDHDDLLRVIDAEVRSLDSVARVEAFLCLDLHYKRVPPISADATTNSTG